MQVTEKSIENRDFSISEQNKGAVSITAEVLHTIQVRTGSPMILSRLLCIIGQLYYIYSIEEFNAYIYAPVRADIRSRYYIYVYIARATRVPHNFSPATEHLSEHSVYI